jgi:hypothetical protein
MLLSTLVKEVTQKTLVSNSIALEKIKSKVKINDFALQ